MARTEVDTNEIIERAALANLRTELAALRARVTMLEAARSTLSPEDRDTLARILPAVAGALGSELWTVRQLRASEHAGVRVVLDGLSARRLGRLFSRARGVPIGAYLIQRAGVEGHAALWQVVATLVELETPQTPQPSRRLPAGRVTV